MNDSPRHPWLLTAILVGLLYLAIGLGFAALAGAAATKPTQTVWRAGAFIASGLGFAVHLWYEHFRLRSPPRSTAGHAATAVAIGAFGLALVANIHDLGSAAGYRPKMLIALVAWPGLTAVPAFFVALGLAAVLGAKRTPV